VDRDLTALADVPRWAVNQLTSPHTTFEQDLVDYPAAGASGLGSFDPVCVMVLPGNPTTRGPAADRATIVDGLGELAQIAASEGVTLGLEPLRALSGAIIQAIPEAMAVLDDVGSPTIGVVLDTWHVWDSPGLLEQIHQHVGRLVGVQVADWRDPTRGWADRILPGDGVAGLPGIFEALRDAGYQGWYELEIFSDDGTYGTDYPDSLYRLPHAELLRRGADGFQKRVRSADGRGPECLSPSEETLTEVPTQRSVTRRAGPQPQHPVLSVGVVALTA
jgi:sugar phosphate isomerase/epimerase